MRTDNLLAQRRAALEETQAQIAKVEKLASKDPRVLKVLQELRVKEKRQAEAVAVAELQLELGI